MHRSIRLLQKRDARPGFSYRELSLVLRGRAGELPGTCLSVCAMCVAAGVDPQDFSAQRVEAFGEAVDAVAEDCGLRFGGSGVVGDAQELHAPFQAVEDG